MKILDLLEQIQATYNKHKSQNSFDKNKDRAVARRLNPDWRNPKHGSFGRVYSSGDPHLINKISHEPELAENDGYMRYIKFLINSDIASGNPFAPRIYKMSEFEDGFGMSKYKVKMETLHSFKEADPELLTAMAEQLFDKEDLIKASRWVGIAGVYGKIPKAIDMTCEGIIRSRNKQLNELCDAIGKLAEDGGVEVDVHGGNIMMRYGKPPQIVITDPLA